ncbi:PAS domain-containing protein [Peribacillus frigoritolerans]|nr:PAS domain-containing protein [Peribacillus frigoritolerans]
MGLAKEVIDHTIEGILITDTTGKIISVNPSFTRITGYQENEVIGKDPSLLKSGRQPQTFYEDMWKSIEKNGFWQGEIWNSRKDGQEYLQWLTISAIKDDAEDVVQYAGMFSDISSHSEKSIK